MEGIFFAVFAVVTIGTVPLVPVEGSRQRGVQEFIVEGALRR
jgi:hypothetical protein